MTFFSSSVFKVLIIVLDLQNALNVPGTTSPSSSILAPAGENFRMQLSRVKNCRKKKPFIVFKRAKREVKKLNEEFKSLCIVVTSVSGWMNA